MKRFSGVIVPVVTLFHPDGRIDAAGQSLLFDRLIEAGVDALFILGTTGEAQHMVPEEREEMIRQSAKQVRGRVPLLAGVGDTSTVTACRLAAAAERDGIDGVVALPPYFWNLGKKHVFAYYEAILQATRLPVILYNFPRYTGIDLSPEWVGEMAGVHPGIVGIKETIDSGTHLRRMIEGPARDRDDFAVYCGHDDLSLFAWMAGADGVVSSTSNFAPEPFVEMKRAIHGGQYDRAAAIARRIARLVEVYRCDPFGASVAKAALRLRGWIETDRPRPPALPLPDDAVHVVRSTMTESGLFTSSVNGDRLSCQPAAEK